MVSPEGVCNSGSNATPAISLPLVPVHWYQLESAVDAIQLVSRVPTTASRGMAIAAGGVKVMVLARPEQLEAQAAVEHASTTIPNNPRRQCDFTAPVSAFSIFIISFIPVSANAAVSGPSAHKSRGGLVLTPAGSARSKYSDQFPQTESTTLHATVLPF
ncbi:hypothetical protein AYM40_21765 [Paraburkholderia phytofirmans OLGA172]|uniref:Uncharacterized protein n=1 Tax=Paraburkholderia phytofirmans OLGA172 TaxID=1417228 RepID=A0A160FQU3_9BURK|nr:hypothetical protein AYM40_21765 [Paraburkholderia phytofirmans OLGA172]